MRAGVLTLVGEGDFLAGIAALSALHHAVLQGTRVEVTYTCH